MEYDHPPLVEAIYEIFASPTTWSKDLSASIEKDLSADYDGKREVLQPVEVQFQVGPGLALKGVRQEPERVA